MASYSHSRISTFEQCRYKYKLQYIDKVKVEAETTVEAFVGDMVHRSLHKLYEDLKYQQLDTVEDILKFYNSLWKKEWTDTIIIAREEHTSENYRKMGEVFLINYYMKYKPFDQLTVIGLETQDRMLLPNGDSYHVRIDKLGCKDNVYYVCDYKTNQTMKDQEEADADRQLAMYSIWVKDRFKDAKKVVLLWHMLAFNKEVTSERSEMQLKKLMDETMGVIKQIEGCKTYPTNVTNLCNWCIFQCICPSFKHVIELEQKPVEEFKEDEGVKLVDEYAELKQKLNETDDKMEELKQKIIRFAQQKNIDVVYGSNKKASVKECETIIFPEEKGEFIELLKEKGLYDEISSVNYMKLSSMILKNELDYSLMKFIKKQKDFKVSLSNKKL